MKFSVTTMELTYQRWCSSRRWRAHCRRSCNDSQGIRSIASQTVRLFLSWNNSSHRIHRKWNTGDVSWIHEVHKGKLERVFGGGMPFHINQLGLGKRHWNLETSSAVVEFPPPYQHSIIPIFKTIKFLSYLEWNLEFRFVVQVNYSWCKLIIHDAN